MSRHMYFTIWTIAILESGYLHANDIVFDNGGPDLVVPNGLFSDFDADLPPGLTGSNQIADNFSLVSGSNTISNINWWGTYEKYDTPVTDDFTIRIFDDDAGRPSTTNFQTIFTGDPGRVNTGTPYLPVLSGGGGKTDLYEYHVNLPAPTSLAPDTPYWLSIVNNTVDDDDDSWVWGTSSSFNNGTAHQRNADGTVWSRVEPSAGSVEMAFNLTNAPVSQRVFLQDVMGAVLVTPLVGDPFLVAPGDLVSVFPGFEIETFGNSSVTVEFESGDQVTLRQNTSFLLEDVSGLDEGTTLWSLITGSVHNVVQSLLVGQEYRFRTSRGPVNGGVRGTEFSVSYLEEGILGTTTVDVLSGLVEISDPNGVTFIAAGENYVGVFTVPEPSTTVFCTLAITLLGLLRRRV